MKTVTYDLEKMNHAGKLLNMLNVCGVGQARILAQIGDILDSGQIGEIMKKEKDNGLHRKEVQED